MAPTTVLVTGCSAGGIGSSIAFSFAKRGFHVLATARNTSKIDPKLSSLENVDVIELDVTNEASIASSVKEAEKALKEEGLGFLVNNSGVGIVMPWLDLEMSEARRLFETNFWGVLAVTKAFMPLLIKGKGTVANVASISAKAWNPYEAIYNASKAAVQQFGDTIRLELEPLGVKVVTIMSGMVQSQWYENSVPALQLPEASYYHPVLKNIQDGATGVDNKKNAMPVDTFGENVVTQLIGGKTGKIWAGAMSTLTWVVGFLPEWYMDNILRDRSGLKNLQRPKHL